MAIATPKRWSFGNQFLMGVALRHPSFPGGIQTFIESSYKNVNGMGCEITLMMETLKTHQAVE